ncbi:MAG: D-aminopeptidase dipeptide-binding protein DppA [Candidatus Ozemobacter sibiricus]|uniref:D-aminopeptidase dipeptide-binding protein DppA n=1 Tax=Candidatus Ozemobacter sibiricus TaxID=2268124 RepID=A0A367ZKQ6_9BACT|nr:MAG: D-aminopeptidase dipeptide-binding protein DppA [Candidatus Ozemobacter sibiricus]
MLLLADIEGSSECHDRAGARLLSRAWAQACLGLTDDVAAVARRLLEEGTSPLTIYDFHRTGFNLLPERLPAGTRLFLRQGYRLGPLPGLGRLPPGTASLVMLGMHAASGTPGFLAHTLTSRFREIRFRGHLLTEAELFAGAAGTRGLAPRFFSGCEEACRQAAATIPGLVTFPVPKPLTALEPTTPPGETAPTAASTEAPTDAPTAATAVQPLAAPLFATPTGMPAAPMHAQTTFPPVASRSSTAPVTADLARWRATLAEAVIDSLRRWPPPPPFIVEGSCSAEVVFGSSREAARHAAPWGFPRRGAVVTITGNDFLAFYWNLVRLAYFTPLAFAARRLSLRLGALVGRLTLDWVRRQALPDERLHRVGL